MPNSIVLASENGIFFENFRLGAHFFVPKFRFMQICAAFQLLMGQRVGLHRRFPVFYQFPSFHPPKWHFFENFLFGVFFFFASKFRFMQICEAFRLEIGQRVGLRKRFIIFLPIPSVFLGQTLDLHIFVLLFNWKWVNEKDSIGDLSFSAKFHRFGLRNGIFF